MSGLGTGGTSFHKGIDPKAEEERLRRIELRKQQSTFAAVAEDYLERHTKGQRRASDSEREIRKELIGPLGDRPIASITREDVVLLVDSVAGRPAPYLAHIVLGHARTMTRLMHSVSSGSCSIRWCQDRHQRSLCRLSLTLAIVRYLSPNGLAIGCATDSPPY